MAPVKFLENLTLPKAIFPTATIGAFTPSDALTDQRKVRVVSGAASLVNVGYKVRFAKNALDFCSSTDLKMRGRDTDILELLHDPDINALIATHGGKSCIDLIRNGLDYSLIRKQRKAIIGFSDVCILLNLITSNSGLISFYGPNVLSKIDQSHWSDLRSLNKTSSDFCRAKLFQNTAAYTCIRGGSSVGHLFGGNLECFTNGLLLSKAKYKPPNPGIFIWESSGLTAGDAYQILSALRHSGFLDNVTGMVIGDAFRDPVNSLSECLDSVVNACEGTTFPIVFKPGFGHGDSIENPIIPLGARAFLDATRGEIEVLDQYISCD
jgi:muramoyltetrapeptide carboxypeptidase